MTNVTDYIRSHIEAEIFNGGIESGVQIDEKYVMQRFSVSRTPAREALVHLAAIGLLGVVPRKGYTVLPLTPKEYLELSEILEVNESLAARLAASRITKEQLMDLFHALKGCKKALDAQDANEYRKFNGDFHQIIYASCGNNSLQDTILLLRARMRGIADVRFSSLSRMQNSYIGHEKIYIAIAEGSENEAAKAMCDHILSGSGNFRHMRV